MTEEFAITCLLDSCKKCSELKNGECISESNCFEVKEAAIKALHNNKIIDDIKSDIADLMSQIPCLGNCKEGWHNAGQRLGLEQACEIIDIHMEGDKP